MPDVALDVQGVSKRFRLHHERKRSVRERLLRTGPAPYEDLWAVRDVSVQVAVGETLGILGRNGSGKSTLLKCICGVLQPTSGQVVQRGAVAGLLELGAGFQQELSGRDNVYLNGSLLGLSRREMDRRFDDIVAFAELEEFIDNQVKFYSSGMYVRLGFAVAVNIDPDILVIDEVLAVGDERFQRKCLERVQQFQEEGRTIVLVSHSPDQVRAICDRAMVMHNGSMIGIGAPGEAVRTFREHVLEAGPSQAGPHLVQRFPLQIDRVQVVYPGPAGRQYLCTDEPCAIRASYVATEHLGGIVLNVEVRDLQEHVLYRTDAGTARAPLTIAPGPGELELAVDRVPMLDGAFEVAVDARAADRTPISPTGTCRFEVMNPGRDAGSIGIHLRADIVASGPNGALVAG